MNGYNYEEPYVTHGTANLLNNPRAIAIQNNAKGREEFLYVADTMNGCVRRYSFQYEVIDDFAGRCGFQNYSGDGGPAILAELYHPLGVAVDAQGNVYIAGRFVCFV